MGLTCPQCGVYNPDEAGRCVCGYDFRARHQWAFPLRPILWLIGGGVLIGWSSCFGFVNSLDTGLSAVGVLFAIGFFGGVAAIILGILVAIVWGIVRLTESPIKPQS